MTLSDKNPLVCIIIVNYNGWQDTIDCVESISCNSYSNYRVIIVDNCSTDESSIVLSKLADNSMIYFIQAEENKGFSAGNNIGIKKAVELGAEFFMLLNNDTIVTMDFLSHLVDSYRESNIKNSVFTGLILYEKDRNRIWYAGGSYNKNTALSTHHYMNETMGDIKLRKKEVSFISGCEMLCPISVIDKVGYMDDDYFLYAEDVDFCCRLSKNGYRLFFDPTSVIFHKVSASTSKISSASQYYSVRNRRLLIKKNIQFPRNLIALLFTDIQTLHRIARGRLIWKCVKAGVIDFYCGKTGKCERSF